MDDDKKKELKLEMAEIHAAKEALERLIVDNRRKIHKDISSFSNWKEVYEWCVENTSSREEFNSVCRRLRESWLNYKMGTSKSHEFTDKQLLRSN